MIIVELSGGMGNQMFQYAAGRALALKNNTELGLDLSFLLDRTPHPKFQNFVFRNYDLDIFNIDAKIVEQSEIPFWHRNFFSGKVNLWFNYFCHKFVPYTGKEKHFHFDKTILDLGPDTYLHGLWQSPKYFQSIESTIRKDFELKAPLSENVSTLMREIVSCESLCVNVRRADFVTNNFHGTFGPEYYDNAVAEIARTNNIDKIYVFSDDIPWCEENLKFPFPTMFVGKEYAGKKFEQYLMLMAACKNFVIPNSTFGWWAAWLSKNSQKKVVVPKRWFGNERIVTDDLVLPEWIRI